MFYIDSKVISEARIKVVGVGGGGGNALDTMILEGLHGVEFIAANTDKQSLECSRASFKIQLGEISTKGLGAGGNPDIGREAALEDEETLRGILSNSDMVFITAGMGGGTGTGAAPVIARIARETGALTIAVVTKPFILEGKKRQKQAEAGLKELKNFVDTLITIPNERLLSIIGKDTSLVDGFKKVDEVLLQAVRGISDLISKPGFINLDFADIKSVMKNSKGVALLGIGSGVGENKARVAAMEAMNCPLLENLTIDGATGLIVNITAGPTLPLQEITEGAASVTEAAGEDADVKFGVVIDENLGDEIRITVIATGFSQVEEDSVVPFQSYKETKVRFDIQKYMEKKDRKNTALPSVAKEQNLAFYDDDLEIPAFMRKRKKQK